jgi:hypothetical protein
LRRLRDTLRAMRRSIGKARPVPAAIVIPPSTRAVTLWKRLTPAQERRKAALAHRLALIRGQLESGRSWQMR